MGAVTIAITIIIIITDGREEGINVHADDGVVGHQ